MDKLRENIPLLLLLVGYSTAFSALSFWLIGYSIRWWVLLIITSVLFTAWFCVGVIINSLGNHLMERYKQTESFYQQQVIELGQEEKAREQMAANAERVEHISNVLIEEGALSPCEVCVLHIELMTDEDIAYLVQSIQRKEGAVG